MSNHRKLFAATGSAAALVAGIAFASSSIGAVKNPAEQRATAVLEATQLELKGTDSVVTSAHLAQIVDGAELYILRGPGTVCLLSAWPEDPDGKSRSLSCGRPAVGARQPVLSDQVRGKSGRLITVAAIEDSVSGQLTAVGHGGSRVYPVTRRGGIASSVSDEPVAVQLRGDDGSQWQIAGVSAQMQQELDKQAQKLVDLANEQSASSEHTTR